MYLSVCLYGVCMVKMIIKSLWKIIRTSNLKDLLLVCYDKTLTKIKCHTENNKPYLINNGI